VGTAVDLSVRAEVTDDPAAYPAVLFQAFRLGSLWCYTGFDEASELVSPLKANWVPNTPPWFKGLAQLNGYVVPVIDLTLADAQVDSADQAPPLFHLLFGRLQQRIAVAIHSLPFTVTATLRAQPVPLALPLAFARIVDSVLLWSDVAHTAGSASLKADGQTPQHLHHLNGALLENWFSHTLHVRSAPAQSVPV
jgi:hypothetical protein